MAEADKDDARHLKNAADALGISVASLKRAVHAALPAQTRADPAGTVTGELRHVFGTLRMPNGRTIKTMREDAFQTALTRSGNKASR